MAVNKSRKQLIKAIVLTVGVADCVGIYLVSSRLDTAVPDEIRYDMAAYTIPENTNIFHAERPAFAEAAAPKLAVAAARAPVVKAAPVPAHAAIVTPHLANVDKPDAGFRAAGAKITSARLTAGLVLDHAAPAKAVVSLAGLVPKTRASLDFASAFSGFDTPLGANVPLENVVAPTAAGDGANAFAQNGISAPVLEVVIPEAAPELPAMTAAADTPEAAL